MTLLVKMYEHRDDKIACFDCAGTCVGARVHMCAGRGCRLFRHAAEALFDVFGSSGINKRSISVS